MKRVVYYTEAAYFDLGLSFIRAMSRLVELHVLLQVRPRMWPEGQLDLPPVSLPAGIVAAEPVLADLPAGVRSSWQNVASFRLVVHNEAQTLHPANWMVSHKAVQLMNRLRPEVIHLEGLPGRLAWALPELRACPLVLTVHDPEPHSGRSNWKETLARRLALGRSDRFILHNHAQRDLFCSRYRVAPGRVDVLPLGAYYASREWSAGPTGDDGRTILFFGQISPYKGLDTLYQAAPLVAERVPGVRLIVAGKPVPGYQPPAVPALPNGGQVQTIERHIRNAEAARLFQEATVVVCPYNDATQSGVVLTAFAFGKPVVATRVGGLPEYVTDGETGLLVPPRAPELLAAGLADILQTLSAEPERRRFEDAILARCRGDLAWDNIAQQTVAVYERARASRRPIATTEGEER